MNDLFSVLGWEDRFLEGLHEILKRDSFKRVFLLIFEDYLNNMKMHNNLSKVKELLNKENIELIEIKLEYNNSIDNWTKLNDLFAREETTSPYINLTTIPRETIWTLLFFLKSKHDKIKYIYFKPNSYTKNWLTKNYKEPRLLFKHSGVFGLEKKLALIVIRGFDKSRLHQLVNFFEPNHLYILTQKQNEFEREREKIDETDFSPEINIQKSIIDSYDFSSSLSTITKLVNNLKSDFNIIIASQGPKLSSLFTYKCQIENPEVALSYVPAIDFNIEYSTGLNREEPIFGEFYF